MPEGWGAEWAGVVLVTPPPLLPATVSAPLSHDGLLVVPVQVETLLVQGWP